MRPIYPWSLPRPKHEVEAEEAYDKLVSDSILKRTKEGKIVWSRCYTFFGYTEYKAKFAGYSMELRGPKNGRRFNTATLYLKEGKMYDPDALCLESPSVKEIWCHLKGYSPEVNQDELISTLIER